jgi:flavin-dependent dehydrogenase
MPKVHVVGAGPAGSIAAISAIRSGSEVVVSEEHASAGLPENCSGLFSKDGLDSLSGFLDYRHLVINKIFGADIHLGGEKMSLRRSSPVAFVCDRAAMDQLLAKNAEEEGARINYGERAEGSFHAENIIGADGPHSHVARHFSFPPIKAHATTMQSLVEYRAQEPHVVQVYLSNEKFPGFFSWVIPHDEYHAEFGVGVETPHRPAEAWERLLRMKGVEAASRPRGFVIPLCPRPRTAMRCGRRNVLLAGDAAGQVKSTTGGGVVFGGNCAALAGKFATDPARYEFEWKSRFGADLAMHGWAHDYLASQSDAALAALCRRLKKLNFEGFLSDSGHMDRPTKMLRPSLLKHMIKNLAGLV